MRIYKIIFLLLLGMVTGVIIESCCDGYNFRWTYIICKNLENDSIVNIDSISKEAFGIKINFFDQKYAFNKSNPFISKSFAFDCWPVYTNEDSVMSIELITVNKLNNERPALSNVADLFYGSVNAPVSYYNDSTIFSDMIPQMNSGYMYPIREIYLKLHVNEITDDQHRFIIKIRLSDNRVLTDTTQTVRIY